jgi:outer membrane protein assembly factor BamB
MSLQSISFWVFCTSLLCFPCLGENRWPAWHGADQLGVAPPGNYPIKWSETENLLWKTDLPGRGGSTPIVWGNSTYVTSSDGEENLLFSLDLASGKINWQAQCGKALGGKHRKGSGANPSVVTDGKLIYAYFRSGDLACVTATGSTLWQINLQQTFNEDPETFEKRLWWDLGTSPVLTNDAVVITVMQSGPSYLAAFDKQTGKTLWKHDRMLDAPEEAAQSYSTPIVTTHQGQQLLIVLGADHVTCHKAENGEELWKIGGFNPDAERYFRSIASPIILEGIVVCPYARGKTLTGIRLSDQKIVWKRDDLGADVPTPAGKDGRVYVCTDKGHVECIQVADGSKIWEGELGKSRWAVSSSPLLAGGKIYITREDGRTFVLRDGDSFELLAENPLGETDNAIVAGLAPITNGFLMRNAAAIFCISSSPSDR